jgi:hypothetical protein
VTNILHPVTTVSRQTGIPAQTLREQLRKGTLEGVNLNAGKPGRVRAKWRVKDRALRKLKGGEHVTDHHMAEG